MIFRNIICAKLFFKLFFMNTRQLSTWVWVISQQVQNKRMFSVLQKCRNLTGALLLSAASLSFAQEKPHTLAEDVNFSNVPAEHTVLPSDPSPNMVWHKSLDADVSLRHTGARWEVDEGVYGSIGGHWGTDDYSLAVHYVSNLFRNTPFEWHAIKNEMELRWLFLHQLTPNTQLQWWVWAFTEQPLENTHEPSSHTTNTHDVHDSHDPHASEDPKKEENDTHDSGGHKRLTIIAPTIGLQHVFSDKLRLLLTSSAGLDMTWWFHSSSSVEILGNLLRTERFTLIYNAGVNHATQIGTSFEWSAGVVFTNKENTWRFFFVGDVNHNLGADKTVFWLRTGFSFNLGGKHH